MSTPALLQPIELEASRAHVAEEVAARFLVGYGNEHTRAAYARDLRGFGAWCGSAGVDPLEASRAHVELYARTLEARGLAPATVSRHLTTLAGFYRYACDEGLLDRSPVAHLRRPRVPAESPTLGLDRTEARAFLRAAEADPRDHALACLLTLNALRVSEACRAAVEDLGEERGHHVLQVRGKGGRLDLIPLAPRTWGAIADHLDGRSTGPLILAADGRELNRHRGWRIVRRLARRAGIAKRITPHSLRHTAVTLALDAGASLRDVQDLARHADPRTTRRYDRARGALDRHATYALAGYVS